MLKDFARALKAVSAATADFRENDGRAYLRNVFIEGDASGGRRLMATDSRWFARWETAGFRPLKKPLWLAQISRNDVKSICDGLAALPGDVSEIKFSHDQTAPVISAGRVASIRVEDPEGATYPQYQRVIPKEGPQYVSHSANIMAQDLRRFTMKANPVLRECAASRGSVFFDMGAGELRHEFGAPSQWEGVAFQNGAGEGVFHVGGSYMHAAAQFFAALGAKSLEINRSNEKELLTRIDGLDGRAMVIIAPIYPPDHLPDPEDRYAARVGGFEVRAKAIRGRLIYKLSPPSAAALRAELDWLTAHGYSGDSAPTFINPAMARQMGAGGPQEAAGEAG